MEELLFSAGILVCIQMVHEEEAEIAVLHPHKGGTHKILGAVAVENAALAPGLAFVVGANATDIGGTPVVIMGIVMGPSVKNGVVLQTDKAPF
jgi:hypothetical protein